jgi:hypothetical protein
MEILLLSLLLPDLFAEHFFGFCVPLDLLSGQDVSKKIVKARKVIPS